MAGRGTRALGAPPPHPHPRADADNVQFAVVVSHEREPTMLAPNEFVRGRYLIVQQIGSGATGGVYEALDMETRLLIALKQIAGAGAVQASAGGSFEREVRALLVLRHPALPVVSDVFVEDDSMFLVMEFVPGDDLATLLARNGGPFTTVQALRWADQLLDVLDYLHTRQPPSLHRDIKPQNLKLTPRGKIMLLDFGLAKAGWSAAQEKQAGRARLSSLQFLPPEQVAGAGADARSDLFALAATLYYLLTGELPALAGRRANAAARGLPDPLRPIHEVNPQVPAPVSAVLMQALALDPAQRPASAAEMRV